MVDDEAGEQLMADRIVDLGYMLLITVRIKLHAWNGIIFGKVDCLMFMFMFSIFISWKGLRESIVGEFEKTAIYAISSPQSSSM